MRASAAAATLLKVRGSRRIKVICRATRSGSSVCSGLRFSSEDSTSVVSNRALGQAGDTRS